MATESVATPRPETSRPAGTACDLLLNGEDVLTIYIDRRSNGFPPESQNIKHLHRLTESLARASTAVTWKIVQDEGSRELWAGAADDIAHVIALLTQLADGVAAELNAKEAQA
jgi:hypothetical protein